MVPNFIEYRQSQKKAMTHVRQGADGFTLARFSFYGATNFHGSLVADMIRDRIEFYPWRYKIFILVFGDIYLQVLSRCSLTGRPPCYSVSGRQSNRGLELGKYECLSEIEGRDYVSRPPLDSD